jgi:hypothetical protein
MNTKKQLKMKIRKYFINLIEQRERLIKFASEEIEIFKLYLNELEKELQN